MAEETHVQQEHKDEIQYETIYTLRMMYGLLTPKEQQYVDIDNPFHLYWMLEMILNKHGVEFKNKGPPKTIFNRNCFVQEMQDKIKQLNKKNWPHTWQTYKLYNNVGDPAFLTFCVELYKETLPIAEAFYAQYRLEHPEENAEQ